jgi:hypothetical protein
MCTHWLGKNKRLSERARNFLMKPLCYNQFLCEKGSSREMNLQKIREYYLTFERKKRHRERKRPTHLYGRLIFYTTT